jgi:hypothetical protein
VAAGSLLDGEGGHAVADLRAGHVFLAAEVCRAAEKQNDASEKKGEAL